MFFHSKHLMVFGGFSNVQFVAGISQTRCHRCSIPAMVFRAGVTSHVRSTAMVITAERPPPRWSTTERTTTAVLTPERGTTVHTPERTTAVVISTFAYFLFQAHTATLLHNILNKLSTRKWKLEQCKVLIQKQMELNVSTMRAGRKRLNELNKGKIANEMSWFIIIADPNLLRLFFASLKTTKHQCCYAF